MSRGKFYRDPTVDGEARVWCDRSGYLCLFAHLAASEVCNTCQESIYSLFLIYRCKLNTIMRCGNELKCTHVDIKKSDVKDSGYPMGITCYEHLTKYILSCRELLCINNNLSRICFPQTISSSNYHVTLCTKITPDSEI